MDPPLGISGVGGRSMSGLASAPCDCVVAGLCVLECGDVQRTGEAGIVQGEGEKRLSDAIRAVHFLGPCAADLRQTALGGLCEYEVARTP